MIDKKQKGIRSFYELSQTQDACELRKLPADLLRHLHMLLPDSLGYG